MGLGSAGVGIDGGAIITLFLKPELNSLYIIE